MEVPLLQRLWRCLLPDKTLTCVHCQFQNRWSILSKFGKLKDCLTLKIPYSLGYKECVDIKNRTVKDTC